MTTASSAVAPSFPSPHRHDWRPERSQVYVVVCGLAAAGGIILLVLCNLPIMTAWLAKFTRSRSKARRLDASAEEDDTYPLVP